MERRAAVHATIAVGTAPLPLLDLQRAFLQFVCVYGFGKAAQIVHAGWAICSLSCLYPDFGRAAFKYEIMFIIDFQNSIVAACRGLR
jgi:hypothetical protein